MALCQHRPPTKPSSVRPLQLRIRSYAVVRQQAPKSRDTQTPRFHHACREMQLQFRCCRPRFATKPRQHARAASRCRRYTVPLQSMPFVTAPICSSLSLTNAATVATVTRRLSLSLLLSFSLCPRVPRLPPAPPHYVSVPARWHPYASTVTLRPSFTHQVKLLKELSSAVRREMSFCRIMPICTHCCTIPHCERKRQRRW